MEFIERSIEERLLNSLTPNKVVVLLGPRRTGKTILIKKLKSKLKEPFSLWNGEDFNVQEQLSRRSTSQYRSLLGSRKMLIIDEAQKIPDIGNKLKLMVDEIEDLKILVTGSSAFDINNAIGEPLTGRKKTLYLFPVSEQEYQQLEEPIDRIGNLRNRLIFGNYPELLHLPDREDKIEYLQELVQSYLLKDILAFENIRNSGKILLLLKLVSFQVGSEVSYQELGNQLGISKNTVEKYLNLLTKVFVLFKVGGFSRNLRKEITKSSKWYFYDNGLRNAIIANLSPLELRNDHGLLWENYIISERIKYQAYARMLVNNHFWRTYDQQEIDWVEDREGKLFAYEMKWNHQKRVRVPAAWRKAYPDATFQAITPQNYFPWIAE